MAIMSGLCVSDSNCDSLEELALVMERTEKAKVGKGQGQLGQGQGHVMNTGARDAKREIPNRRKQPSWSPNRGHTQKLLRLISIPWTCTAPCRARKIKAPTLRTLQGPNFG